MPISWYYCETHEFSIRKKRSFLGFDINGKNFYNFYWLVRNKAYERDGTVHDSKNYLCAETTDKGG